MDNNKKEKLFQKLTQQMKRCNKCKDLPKESYAVFAGSYKNQIMVIGQAPGKQELKYNKPFCGQAGKRLFNWLAKINIKEEEFRELAYFTQMMKCYPGSRGKGDFKPNQSQINNCAPYLAKEFKLIRPALTIPIGKLAIEKLLGKVRLNEVVGKQFRKVAFGIETVIIPLPHPSGISPWSFKPSNQYRITKALARLKICYKKLKG